MKRIFSDFAYGPEPRSGCWWDETCDMPDFPQLDHPVTCDAVIIGAGFTGVSAALHLARAGASVVVLEAQQVGWGASGRNGGFCCLGGGMLEDAQLDRQFGKAGRLEWRATEKAAVAYVSDLIKDLNLDVDQHSSGETLLAHTARAASGFDQDARRVDENYGVPAEVLSAAQAAASGFGGAHFGALTIPIGFGLNPRKFLRGLVRAACDAGVRIFNNSGVQKITQNTVQTAKSIVTADQIIVATNGYSSEDIPRDLAGRYMPTQSNVLVTEPLSSKDLAAQGWSTDQMAYDSRRLLHYFRLMPDRRFLFGMRGGLFASGAAETRARKAVVADFHRMFPAWRHVKIPNQWSGMVCLTRNRLPFVSRLAGRNALFAGVAYHGNGVAMGTFSGAILADLALDRTPNLYPQAMRVPLRTFPLGPLRRAILPPIYAAFKYADWRR